jgi:hypothetical protein
MKATPTNSRSTNRARPDAREKTVGTSKLTILRSIEGRARPVAKPTDSGVVLTFNRPGNLGIHPAKSTPAKSTMRKGCRQSGNGPIGMGDKVPRPPNALAPNPAGAIAAMGTHA